MVDVCLPAEAVVIIRGGALGCVRLYKRSASSGPCTTPLPSAFCPSSSPPPLLPSSPGSATVFTYTSCCGQPGRSYAHDVAYYCHNYLRRRN